MSTYKPQGMKFNWISGSELAGTVIMFLLLIPFALRAYSYYKARSNYRAANDFYIIGNFVGAKQVLDKAIEARPELYHPRELLAMALYLQREPAQAEQAYQVLARSDEFQGAPERKQLASLAVLSLKLIQQRAAGKANSSDPAYAAAAQEVSALANGRLGAFLEGKVIEAQVDLDRLTESAGPQKGQLELIRKKLEEVDKQLDKGVLSPWGAAVLYNSLGVVNFQLGVEQWDKLDSTGAQMTPKVKADAYVAASKDTEAAVRGFRRSLQMRLLWPVPFVNFEQAMAFKLVEKGLPLSIRKYWIDYAADYIRVRDEHLSNLSYGLKLKLDKDFDTTPKENDYALKNSLGWACSLVGYEDPPNAAEFHSKASSTLRDAKRVNDEAGIAHYNLARTRALLWKQNVGLDVIARKTLADAVNETTDTYRGASEHSGAARDPLRRCRMFNNMGVFWYKGKKDHFGGIRYLEEALKVLKDVLANPQSAGAAERQGLEDVIKDNLRVIYQRVLEDPTVSAPEKAAVGEKMNAIGAGNNAGNGSGNGPDKPPGK